MKTVRDVIFKQLSCSGWNSKDYIEISHSNGYLNIDHKAKSFDKESSISSSEDRFPESIVDTEKMSAAVDSFKKYEEYTKADLEYFQKIISVSKPLDQATGRG